MLGRGPEGVAFIGKKGIVGRKNGKRRERDIYIYIERERHRERRKNR